jgi:hypothetical protein
VLLSGNNHNKMVQIQHMVTVFFLNDNTSSHSILFIPCFPLLSFYSDLSKIYIVTDAYITVTFIILPRYFYHVREDGMRDTPSFEY